MKHLYKKELAFYLNNPVGYVVILLFGVFANFLFVKDLFLYGTSSMRSFFDILPWLFMVFIPTLTMRSIAEERRTGTLDILATLPVSELQIVLAKFAAVMTVAGIGLLLTIGLPISLAVLTSQAGSHIYLPEVGIGYLGSLLGASLFAAVGMFFSSLTKNQMVAFLGSVLTCFLLLVMGGDFVTHLTNGPVQDILNYASPMTQLSGFEKGVVDARSVYYFVSVAVLGIFVTTTMLERRS